jgi:citrate synthase
MKKELSSKEAAAILGVSAATLYAYVSRGLLASIADGKARSKRYAHEDVLRLAARKADGKRAGHAVAAAMSWGVPVLESRISLIADGKLYYRGRDSSVLAASATLEQAAAILGGDAAPADADAAAAATATATAAAAAPDGLPRLPAAVAALARKMPPLERAMAFLPVLALQSCGLAGTQSVPSAQLMRMLAGLLLDVEVTDAPLHEQVARAWRVDGPGKELLRAALVVMADHELNNSAFTVRCVASTGAALPAVLCAGLAALSGREHGGHYLMAKEVIVAQLSGADAPALQPMRPGFGHPLYPHGDPRAALLLQMMSPMPQAAGVLALAARAAAIKGAEPNSDFALAALELVLDLPPHSGIVLFALARSAGWLAHAAEQAADGGMIRPRARYIGEFGAA